MKNDIAFLPALSVRQPWAWLLAHGLKDVENRTWYTSFRGWFLIHAGKKFDISGLAWVRARFPEIELPTEFERGGLVGVAKQTATVKQSPSPWFVGPYGFVVRGARPLPFRPLKGVLKFFDVPLDDELRASLFECISADGDSGRCASAAAPVVL